VISDSRIARRSAPGVVTELLDACFIRQGCPRCGNTSLYARRYAIEGYLASNSSLWNPKVALALAL
jgi:hypothetical protein